MSDEPSEPTAKSEQVLALERIAQALEYTAMAAFSAAQHMRCNHLKCRKGAVKLALSADGKAVVPVCGNPEHAVPELPEPPEPKSP